ncbi:hypothetical protein BCIN_10g06150 [Botrytis cinerea B05.10]|uniref:Uncharacterized protein n=1 Tax=Botryotinia fuckeliana (strain B05.10) TaxID=332648 RepID=A0A384JVN7_BOTFB|nr:hypothetical protein BCIN_10g06150 [Botrytis cinerea B05.10]ATZ54633.1 hypothetical protein BCIN_10g06150 [Botrytis cinerea B05.10]
MDMYKAIVDCLFGSNNYHEDTTSLAIYDNKLLLINTNATEIETAEALLSLLLTSEKLGDDLETRLKNIVKDSGLVHADGLWYEGLAKILLKRLESLIKEGQSANLTGAVKEAFDKAKGTVDEFVRNHPVLTSIALTLLVLGLLMYAAPWAVHALGFTLDGPLEGSFAAGWQSAIGNVEAGSWFAFWQRLGMTWGK